MADAFVCIGIIASFETRLSRAAPQDEVNLNVASVMYLTLRAPEVCVSKGVERSSSPSLHQRRFALGRLLLACPHSGVDGIAGEQGAVIAAFDDAAGFEHQYLVGIDDG